MSFTTITDDELVGMGVTGLDDTPELSTEAMQAQFDEYPQFLKDKFKTHITELEANTAASDIGATIPEELTDVTSEKVQDILDALAGGQSTHAGRTDNPHSVTKTQVGLGNVPNVTTDDQTPTISEAEEYSNLETGDTFAVIVGKIKKAITTLTSHMVNTSNPHSVTKSQIGLGNVDNTSDANKPVSTATQTALNGKAPTSHASADPTYGIGNGSNYGHVKLFDTYNPETPGEASDGIGASQKALKDCYDAILEEIQQAGWGDMLRTVYDPDRDGVIGIAQGGTGETTAAGVRNKLGLGNTTGALPIANGGTGETTAAGIRNALGLGNTTDALPIANGGTGQTTVAGVRNELGLGNTTGALPIANGGTGATTKANAVSKLGAVNKNDLTNINITSGTKNNTGSTILSGTYFYYKDNLVKSITDIANNATLTSGTNYEAVTAGGLNALNDDITALNSDLTNLITRGAFKVNVTANTLKVVTSADVLSGALPTYPLNCSFTTSGSASNNFLCSIHLESDDKIRIWADKTQDIWVRWIQYHY